MAAARAGRLRRVRTRGGLSVLELGGLLLLLLGAVVGMAASFLWSPSPPIGQQRQQRQQRQRAVRTPGAPLATRHARFPRGPSCPPLPSEAIDGGEGGGQAAPGTSAGPVPKKAKTSGRKQKQAQGRGQGQARGGQGISSETQWLLDFTTTQLSRAEMRMGGAVKGLRGDVKAVNRELVKRADATDAAVAELKKDLAGRLGRLEVLIAAATAVGGILQYFLANSEAAQKWLGKLGGGG